MPDEQIHPVGTENVPADYVIPSSAELLLKSVYAKYDGSAAAGSFVPLVRIISDAGSVTDEIPQDTTIAAGGSADATWFPRVGGGGAATASTGVQWFYTRRTTTQTMLAGAQDTVIWSDLHSSDSSLFSLAQDNHPNDAVQCAQLGTMLLLAWLLPSALEPNYTLGIQLNGDGGVADDTLYPDVLLGTKSLTGAALAGPQQVTMYIPTVAPFMVETFYHNTDVVNRSLTQAQMWGFFWPNPTANPL